MVLKIRPRDEYADVIESQYRVQAGIEGTHLLACIWRFVDNEPKWSLVQIGDELKLVGPIGTLGFNALLLHFRLASIRDVLTPDVIQKIPPYKLLRCHWELEKEGLPPLKPPLTSHDLEDQIPAAFVK